MFEIYKEDLTSKSRSSRLALMLFCTLGSPTELYGCSCWVSTTAREQVLTTTQMRMMRCSLGRRRGIDVEKGNIQIKA